jgi:hypothetical protein
VQASKEDVGPVRFLVDGTLQATMSYDTSQCTEVAGCYTDGDFTNSNRWQHAWIAPGHTIAIEGDGKGTLGAFSTTLDGFEAMSLPDFPPSITPTVLKDGDDLHVRWNAGDPSDSVSIALGGPVLYMRCRVPDTGSFDPPSDEVHTIVDGSAGDATLFVRRDRVVEKPTGDRTIMLELSTQAFVGLSPYMGPPPNAEQN